MTGEPGSPVPPPEGERDEKDWEERRRVALEAWKMGQKLAESQERGGVARNRRTATKPRLRRRKRAAS